MSLNRSRITGLITKNQHKLALQEMDDYAALYASEFSIEISTHKTKLDALESDNRIGVISRDEYTRDIAKLTMAMLRLLDNLKNTDEKKQKKMNIPISISDGLKENINSVFSMLKS